jgi:Leucine carboxyl methyltransferase
MLALFRSVGEYGVWRGSEQNLALSTFSPEGEQLDGRFQDKLPTGRVPLIRGSGPPRGRSMSSYFAPGDSYPRSGPEPTGGASGACFSGVAQPKAQRTEALESRALRWPRARVLPLSRPAPLRMNDISLLRGTHVRGARRLGWDHRTAGHKGLADTGRLTAAGRAVESRRADRLFEDPLAEALAGEEGFRLMALWRLPGMPEENPTIAPRTRFYDDLVIEAVADRLGQVVLLAAGMDTRAFRLPLPAEVIVFELDLPELREQTQAILEQQHAESRCHRIVVPADLANDDWPQALATAGFDDTAPAVLIAEGLSWYLTGVDAHPPARSRRVFPPPGMWRLYQLTV